MGFGAGSPLPRPPWLQGGEEHRPVRRQAQRSDGAAIAHLSELSVPSEFWKISARTSSSLLARPEDSGHASFVEDKRKHKGVPLCLADAAVGMSSLVFQSPAAVP